MPLWLLTGFGAVRKVLARLFTLACKYPWQAACLALVLFGVWEWRGWNHTQARLSACESGRKADRLSYTRAQQEALTRALAAKAAQEADYRTKAERADHDADKAIADARTAADRYIAAHRVRYQAASGSAGGPVASADGGDPGLPAGLPADSLVAVSDGDVQACSEATAYAVKAHDWALSLGN